MHVPDLEAGPLPRQTARTERREPALVGDLRQRVRLVHELRELRGTEELPDGRHHRLRVDQVMGHCRRHFLIHGHLFLDGALHADQADTELVLEQFAHRPHAAIAEMIDVVDVGGIPPQLEQVLDYLVEILRAEHLLVERGVESELRVQLEPADAREIVLLRVEEHVLEQRSGTVRRGRISRPQPAINLD